MHGKKLWGMLENIECISPWNFGQLYTWYHHRWKFKGFI